jgi:molybdopterin-binding protein
MASRCVDCHVEAAESGMVAAAVDVSCAAGVGVRSVVLLECVDGGRVGVWVVALDGGLDMVGSRGV